MKMILNIEYYTIHDVAQQFGKSEPTVYRWINSGKLNGVRVGNELLFTTDDIQRFIDESRKGVD